VFYLLRQGVANEDVKDVSIYNNLILGDYENLIYFANTAQDTNLVFANNYYAGAALQDSVGVFEEADEAAWWSTTNEGDAADLPWFRNWGGYGPLPSITATPAGLYPVGVQTAQKAATVSDPVITSSQPGFETPVAAALTLAGIGQSGITLTHRVRNMADLAAAIYWTAAYPADSTGTWANEYKGVLETGETED